ncbi:MAG TPA: histidine phosphatase family protein [Ktedonobacteraceae bacterium]|nr:histidine phosphatase family protein [Ktedonobacteraceae bacterium]
MTHLYLIRHGEALGAVQHIIGDTPLSPRGIIQAEHLRDRLAATGEIVPDVLIASTFTRARQTAEIIAPALGLPIILDDEVQELRNGDSDGMSIEEYRAVYGGVNFRETPFRPVAPNGESWGTFVLRACTVLDRITREYEDKTIVIVCHGGIIGASFLYFLHADTLHYPQAGFDPANTSITHWARYSIPDRPLRWRLESFNDAFHLRGIDAQGRIPWAGLSSSREKRVQ